MNVYYLIRLVHHLGKITTKVVNNSPRSFTRLTKLLIGTIKPAVSNEKVIQLLEGNARNWSYTTQLILEEHYNLLIDLTLVLFTAEMCNNSENRRANRVEQAQQHTTNPTPPNTYAQMVVSDTPSVVRPRTGVQHVSVQIQISPRRDNNPGGWCILCGWIFVPTCQA